MLVRMDNTATIAYINQKVGVRTRCMSQLTHHLLLWSQHRLKSLHATHILVTSTLLRTLFHGRSHSDMSGGSTPDDPANLKSIYPDVRGGPAMQNLLTSYHCPFLNAVRGAWAPKSVPCVVILDTLDLNDGLW